MHSLIQVCNIDDVNQNSKIWLSFCFNAFNLIRELKSWRKSLRPKSSKKLNFLASHFIKLIQKYIH